MEKPRRAEARHQMAANIEPRQAGKGGSPCGGPGQPPCPKKKSDDEPDDEEEPAAPRH
ncbi:hypothetical protein GCM10009664_21420 [Kitasatospora gansuensis]